MAKTVDVRVWSLAVDFARELPGFSEADEATQNHVVQRLAEAMQQAAEDECEAIRKEFS